MGLLAPMLQPHTEEPGASFDWPLPYRTSEFSWTSQEYTPTGIALGLVRVSKLSRHDKAHKISAGRKKTKALVPQNSCWSQDDGAQWMAQLPRPGKTRISPKPVLPSPQVWSWRQVIAYCQSNHLDRTPAHKVVAESTYWGSVSRMNNAMVAKLFIALLIHDSERSPVNSSCPWLQWGSQIITKRSMSDASRQAHMICSAQ